MKIYDEKLKRSIVKFNEYELKGATACPECHRSFKDYDIKNLEERGIISCVKCGAKLKKCGLSCVEPGAPGKWNR